MSAEVMCEEGRTETVIDAANTLASLVTVSNSPSGEGSGNTPPSKSHSEEPTEKAEEKVLNNQKRPPQQPKPPQRLPASESKLLSSHPTSSSSSAKSGSKVTKFPTKLMNILMENEHDDIIGWSEEGRTFTIHNPKRFVSDVLPKYFRQTKFTSFLRKLYRWGFVKRSNNDSLTYFHPKFQEGRWDLCPAISCNTRKGSAVESKGPSDNNQFSLEHGRQMMPGRSNMNDGYFPAMMFHGGRPQYPDYNFHGQPPPHPPGPPVQMYHTPMNGLRTAGTMNMNDPRNNPMLMEKGIYTYDIPPLHQGMRNWMPSMPRQPPMYNGGGPDCMGMEYQKAPAGEDVKRNNEMLMDQSMQKHEDQVQQWNNSNTTSTLDKVDNSLSVLKDSSPRNTPMIEYCAQKDTLKPSQHQQHQIQQNNIDGIPLNKNGVGTVTTHVTTTDNQGINSMGNIGKMRQNASGMMRNNAMYEQRNLRQQTPIQHGNNHREKIPMVNHFDQNGYHWQQRHYPMYPHPNGPPYYPMNQQNNTMMPGHEGTLPAMCPPDSRAIPEVINHPSNAIKER